MKLTAALAWYDEPTTHLERCVSSLAGLVDELVALDGRFDPFPGTHVRSPQHQADHLDETALAHGITIVTAAPLHAWRSQITKRTALLELVTIRGADWILVIDADEHIAHADTQHVRQALEHTNLDVAELTLRNVTSHDHIGVPQSRRRIFRAGTTVTDWHNGYTLDGRALAGDPPLEPALDLKRHLRIDHRQRARSPERNAAATTYRHARARTGER